MFSIRVTAQDGSSRTLPFPGTQVSIGRDASNDIVLEGEAVSGRHCMIELQGTTCTLKERGSTNGTWLNNRRLDEPTVIGEQDRFYVGSFLIQLTRMAPAPDRDVSVSAPMQLSGPILRGPDQHRWWRDQHGRLLRYAEQWDREGRAPRLSLDADELRRAKRWLGQADDSLAQEVTGLQREYIEASDKALRWQTIRLVLILAGGFVALATAATLAIVLWPESDAALVADSEGAGSDSGGEEDDDAIVGVGAGLEGGGRVPKEIEPGEEKGDVNADVEHVAIPFESLDDIAKRYGVSKNAIVNWNLLNPEEKNLEGKTIKIKSPTKRPIAQAKIDYEVEGGETWSRVSKRFGIPVTKLRAYNPNVDQLEGGKEIVVWVDPKPYKPREPRKPIPEFYADKSAVSVGHTNNGRVQNGMKMPVRPTYTLITPGLAWGSGYTISNLQKAIATWRQDVDFDGTLVLSNFSKRGGGSFPPHKSHQSGRDIDIWLPTLKGVYKTKYIKGGREKWRRPNWTEVDWYALWGFIRALIKTGAVRNVFLDWRLQEYIYRAAIDMGASQEELDKWIQWPNRSSRAIFRHSLDHLSHIHVRFKCAPWEDQCKDRSYATPGD